MSSESRISRASTVGGTTSITRYTSALAGYGDYGAMQRIATATPSSANVTFSNIPQTYQDLMLVVYGREAVLTGTVRGIYYGFNNLAVASSYTWTELEGSGSAATSGRASANQFTWTGTFGTGIGSNIMSSAIFHILNYKNTTTYKTVLSRTATDYNGAGYVDLGVGLWQNTAAIFEIDMRNTWAAGTTIELFGIKASNS